MLFWLGLGTLVVVPFLHVPWLMESRELPRHLLLWSSTTLLLVSGLARTQSLGHRRWQIAALGFAAILGVASAASPSPMRSLFGAYEGHAGAFSWWAYLGLAACGATFARNRICPWALVFVGVVQGCIGAVQHVMGEPVTGTIGHLTFFAAFEMIAFLMAVGLITDTNRRSVKLALLIFASITVVAVVLSGRRAPLVGIAVGTGLIFLMTDARRRLLPLVSVFLLATVVAFTVSTGREQERLVDRFEQMIGTESVELNFDTVRQRRDYYTVALQAILSRPVIGRGFGSFRDRYAAQKSEHQLRFESRVHSVWLEILLASGAFGLLGFLSVLIAIGAGFRRAIGKSEQRGALLGTAAVAVSYLIFCTVHLDQPAVGAWVWALIGWALAHDPKTVSASPLFSRMGSKFVLAAMGLAIIIGLGNRVWADYEMKRGLIPARQAIEVLEHDRLAIQTIVDRITRLDPRRLFFYYHQNRKDGTVGVRRDKLEELGMLPVNGLRAIFTPIIQGLGAALTNDERAFYLGFTTLAILRHVRNRLTYDQIVLPADRTRILYFSDHLDRKFSKWSNVVHRERQHTSVFLIGRMPQSPVLLPPDLDKETMVQEIAIRLERSPSEIEALMTRTRKMYVSLRAHRYAKFVRELLEPWEVVVAEEPKLTDVGPQIDRAVQAYRAGIRRAPYECLYRFKLASTLRIINPEGSANERVRIIDYCRTVEPANPFVYYHLGLAYADVSTSDLVQRSRAVTALHEAVRRAPSYAPFRQSLAQVLANNGDLIGGLREIDVALRLEPNKAPYHNDRGGMLLLADRPLKAEEAYMRALKLKPNTALYKGNLEMARTRRIAVERDAQK